MYGLATDDSHHYHDFGKDWSNAGRGWVMTKANELNPSSLIESLEAGQFYATTGVVLDEVSFVDNVLTIDVAEEEGISYTIYFIGCRSENSMPEILRSEVATQAYFQLTEDLLFVRCRITSTKEQHNPVEDMVYEMAWTQPVIYDTVR